MTLAPPPPALPGLRIEPVASRRSLGQFIQVPSRVLGSDPAWVQPLTVERRMHLSPRTNPYFSHARWQAWVAVRDGEPVGRISAQIDALHLERHGDATGFFGMLDAVAIQEEADAEIWRELGVKPRHRNCAR